MTEGWGDPRSTRGDEANRSRRSDGSESRSERPEPRRSESGEWLPSGSIEFEHSESARDRTGGDARGAHARGAHERGAHEAPSAFDESSYVQQQHPHFGDPPQLPPEYTPRMRSRRAAPDASAFDTDRASLAPDDSGWDTASRRQRAPQDPMGGNEQWADSSGYRTDTRHDEARTTDYGTGPGRRQYGTGPAPRHDDGAGRRPQHYGPPAGADPQSWGPAGEQYRTGPSGRQYPSGPSPQQYAPDYGTGPGRRQYAPEAEYDRGADADYGRDRGLEQDRTPAADYGTGPRPRHATGPAPQQFGPGESPYDDAGYDPRVDAGATPAGEPVDDERRSHSRSEAVGFAQSPADVHPTEVQPEAHPDEAYYRDPERVGRAEWSDDGQFDDERHDGGRHESGRHGDARRDDQRLDDVPYDRGERDDRFGAAAAGFVGAGAVGAAAAGGDGEPPRDRPFDGFAPADDDDADRTDAAAAPAGRRRAAGRRRRGRLLAGGAAAVVVVGLVVLGWLAFDRFFGGPDLPEDYVGSGGDSVVIRVNPGDTADAIATEMADRDVVASAAAFFNAAVQVPEMNSVQPGYYEVTTRIPAAQAVSELIDSNSRVGNVVISEGRQLFDNTDVNTASVRKGIYTLLSEATCTAGIQCLTPEDFRTAGASTDLDSLSVPDWAAERVRAVPEPDRQLEGLIAAGSWDIDPSADATSILSQLVSESVATYESTGLLTAGEANGLDPYDTLVAASLVERESLPADFAKVARVIVNRLEIGQFLEFDSTVNYALSDTEVATTDADRARVTPWNTYASPGLPQTPICSPSVGAVQAMEHPEPGDWLYFVTINDQGETLFTNDYNQHLANIQQVEPGFLVSGR